MQAELGADAANNRHLLERIRDVGPENRHAQFVCAAALALADDERVFIGRVNGVILDAPRGDAGFGYDPLFLIPALGRTMAELTREEKNEWSHRGRAMRAAREWLEATLVGAGP
jgi:XTP/dITP diphosphohydrolase